MYYGKKLTRETWKYKLEDLNKFKQKKKRNKKRKEQKMINTKIGLFFYNIKTEKIIKPTKVKNKNEWDSNE